MNDNQQVFKYIAIGLIGIFILSIVTQSPASLMFILACFFTYKWYTLSKTTKELQRRHDIYKNKAIEYEEKYRDLIDVDTAIKTSYSRLAELQEAIAQQVDFNNTNTSIEQERKELDVLQIKSKKQQEQKETLEASLADYRKKIAIYQERFDLIDFGIYEPHFSFDHPETYREKIKSVRSKQKELFTNGLAIECTTNIAIDGSRQKGKVFTNKIIKLTGRAFNKECDVAVANVNWKNISKMEKQIEYAFDTINKLNKDSYIVITDSYLKLKLDELRLAYEYQEKRQLEKEEQAEIRRKEKEERKLLEEARKLEAEESKLQELLATVQAKANTSTGDELTKLQEEIDRLGSELKTMQSNSSRVKAMAEQTKLGYVYVISNIGSFGENIFKIGMTRRLDPNERIKELGSASVPFYFDTHAMIFSEDAPALESKLQRAFDDKRVNRVNSRKEYFNVTLDEIKQKVWEINPQVDFVDDAEAQEYRESIALQATHEFRLDSNDDFFDEDEIN